MLAALAVFMLTLPACATLRTSAAEQEEIVTQIKIERPTSKRPGHWVDANGWEFDAFDD